MSSRQSASSQVSSRSSYSTQRSLSPTGTARPSSPARAPSPALTVRSQPPPTGHRSHHNHHHHERGHSRGFSRSRSALSSSYSSDNDPFAARTGPTIPRVPSTTSTSSSSSYRSRTPSAVEPTPSLPRAPSAASNRSRAPSNASRQGLPLSPRRQASGGSTFSTSMSPPRGGMAVPSQQQQQQSMRKQSFGSPQPPHRAPPPPQTLQIGRGPSPMGRSPEFSPSPISPHSYYDERDIDTKTGGEAGMAGVGRRGFAAAARAAMFATQHQLGSPTTAPTARRPNAPPFLTIGTSIPSLPPIGSMGSPLSLSPHSPLSAQSLPHSLSPRSPTLATPPSPTPTNASILRLPPSFGVDRSPVSSVPFPSKSVPPSLSSTLTEPLTPTDDDDDRSPFFESKATPRPPREPLVGADDSDEESIDDMALRLSRELEDLALDLLPGSRPPSTSNNDDSDSDDGGGLAYAASERSSIHSHRRAPSAQSLGHYRTPSAQSVDRVIPTTTTSALSINKSKSQPVTPISERAPSLIRDTPPPVPALDLAAAIRGTSQPASRPESRASNASGSGHRRTGSRGFAPTLEGPDTGTAPVRAPTPGHNRTASNLRGQVDGGPGAWGIVRARTATGAEARTSGAPPDVGRRGGTISGAIGVDVGLERERLRKESAKRARQCVRCRTVVVDGRWVKVESGNGVLCENCWKGMYLPKCRRCGLAIEKQAVSSSDGQLKGKYHRECFNCTTCQKPFPDKEFYVFDGRPYCDYHYHEANGSLCSASSCGRPIEGPCAVSHSGAKYHPEHLTCEYIDDSSDDDSDDSSDYSNEDDDDGDLRRRLGRSTIGPGAQRRRQQRRRVKMERKDQRCTTRLEEYWEVDGRMLCERHLRRVMGEDRMRSERAQRRVTRFIDLTDFR